MQTDAPTPKEQILNPLKDDPVDISYSPGTVYPVGHTGELRKTKEENRELKARVAELEDEVKRQHEGWTDCNTQLDLASRESEHYREALKTIADPSTTCMSWSETVHCLRAHARNALKPMTS